MAEGFSRDRLQPALLDRLIDEAPGEHAEAPESRMITKSAACLPISAAVDGAIETCAALSAGASLIPSPTISTLAPPDAACSTALTLPSGSRPDRQL